MDKGQFMVKIFFSQNLKVIPKTFSDNLKKKLPQSATLKGPSGLTWDVELTTNDDATFFNHGWQKFVKDHSLEETDLLVFRCLTKKRLREGSMVDVHTPLDVDAGCTSSVNSMGDDSVTVPSEQCINSLRNLNLANAKETESITFEDEYERELAEHAGGVFQ
ncbi:B3 domain-containing protein At5g57720-like [Quercus lobata]|uniref:B3 domain-containing protein At5g57720-like n=1 Tax=Quercus lobata TaxID=97700 RepID=UPI0012442D2F|nr:B3 domain-containing protein At5g57720-like [Quercus lobata]